MWKWIIVLIEDTDEKEVKTENTLQRLNIDLENQSLQTDYSTIFFNWHKKNQRGFNNKLVGWRISIRD